MRDLRAANWLEGPVGRTRGLAGHGGSRPEGPLVNPGPECADLGGAKGLFPFGRHLHFGVEAGDDVQEPAAHGLARNEDRTGVAPPQRQFAIVQTQAAPLFRGAVAGDARPLQDRFHVPAEVDFPRGCGRQFRQVDFRAVCKGHRKRQQQAAKRQANEGSLHRRAQGVEQVGSGKVVQLF
jgi:hypothetical protein